MAPTWDIVLALLAGVSVALNGFVLFILTDMRDRIVRLEDRLFKTSLLR